MSDCGSGKWPKARKQHKCEYCFGPILVGETYYRFCGIWQGEYQNWAMHEECHENWSASGDEEFMPGDAPMPERVRKIEEALV